MKRVWWDTGDPETIISFGKSTVDSSSERFRVLDVPVVDGRNDNINFYTLNHAGVDPIVVAKSQATINTIKVADAQVIADYEAKQTDALALLKLNDLSDKTYDQVDTYVDNQVTDLASAKTVLKKYGKILLAILKHSDFA